mmetsp:Transcript_1026/g.2723  ORF Transcript_1026/g.2723 Transcript_1026/m.2723 type:complete len:81 (-) Transcript_1026:564-806(-)
MQPQQTAQAASANGRFRESKSARPQHSAIRPKKLAQAASAVAAAIAAATAASFAREAIDRAQWGSPSGSISLQQSPKAVD